MMGRTTLQEVRDALAAARTGEPKSPTTVAGELEALGRLLKGHADGKPISPPTPGTPVEPPPAEKA